MGRSQRSGRTSISEPIDPGRREPRTLGMRAPRSTGARTSLNTDVSTNILTAPKQKNRRRPARTVGRRRRDLPNPAADERLQISREKSLIARIHRRSSRAPRRLLRTACARHNGSLPRWENAESGPPNFLAWARRAFGPASGTEFHGALAGSPGGTAVAIRHQSFGEEGPAHTNHGRRSVASSSIIF